MTVRIAGIFAGDDIVFKIICIAFALILLKPTIIVLKFLPAGAGGLSDAGGVSGGAGGGHRAALGAFAY